MKFFWAFIVDQRLPKSPLCPCLSTESNASLKVDSGKSGKVKEQLQHLSMPGLAIILTKTAFVSETGRLSL
jgi:hypothetical protein